MTMATSFRIESTVRGHHIFKDTWTPYVEEHAVAVRRDKSVVGHLPHEILRFFVHKRHSKMTCEITGHRHDSRYLSQIMG